MLKKLLGSIEKLNTIVESSIQSGEFSAIDKDLLKAKVRDLYEDILFIDCYDGDNGSVVYFDDESDDIQQESALFQSEEGDVEVEISEGQKSESSESFQSEDGQIEVEISSRTEEPLPQIKKDETDDELLDIEIIPEREPENYDEIYSDCSRAAILEESQPEPVLISAEESEVVVYEAPLEYSLDDLLSPADRERIIISLFAGRKAELDALILKVDAAEDFDSAVLILQESDINHQSEDMNILVEALERRFI